MRVYSREFRMQIVQRILNGEKVPPLSRELGIHRKLLYEWLRQVKEGGESNLRERGRPRKTDLLERATHSSPRPLADLERMLAHQQLIIEFYRQVLQHVQRHTLRKREWRNGVFQAIEGMMQRRGGLSVEAMCELARVARSGYYRYLRSRGAAEGDGRFVP
jgi:transposase-like protein